jgi:hypothetical protein
MPVVLPPPSQSLNCPRPNLLLQFSRRNQNNSLPKFNLPLPQVNPNQPQLARP